MLELNGRESAEAFIIASTWSVNVWKDMNTARDFIIEGLCKHMRNKTLLKHFFETELMGATIMLEQCQGKNCAHVLK